MKRRVVVGVALCCVLAAVFAVGALGATALEDPDFEETQEIPDEFDTTVFRITVFADGDARWTVEYGQMLNETELEDFEAFAETFREEETEASENFRTRAEALTDQGSDATDREMDATAFERDAYVDERGQPRGVIELSFRWVNFAPTENDSVDVGDVFDGGWAITEGQRLELRPGEEMAFAPDSVEPEPDAMADSDSLSASKSITWFGPVEFASHTPQAEFVPVDAVADPPGENSEETEESDEEDNSMLFVFALIALIAGIGGGVVWYAGSLREESSGTAAPSAAAETADPAKPAVSETELLSDEDRVQQLLEENGGRMKQVSIVEDTEWSKSKVSMLLSEMEEEGEISKLRVGRENIISLSGEEPDAARSPFEE